jgi:hypothetical protein
MNSEQIPVTKKIVDAFWRGFDDDQYILARSQMAEYVSDFLLRADTPNEVVIGTYKIQGYFTGESLNFAITHDDTEKLYDPNWRIIKGHSGLGDLSLCKVGDILKDEDILSLLSDHEQLSSSHNTVAEFSDEDSSGYEIETEELLIRYTKPKRDLWRSLYISKDIRMLTIDLDGDNKVIKTTLSYSPLTLESNNDLVKYRRFCGSEVDCVISGNSAGIDVTIYIDEALFEEAGILLHGNAGDLTMINSWYWQRNEKSPNYNKGWILYGFLALDDGNYHWEPYGNDFSDFTDRFEDWTELLETAPSKEELLASKRDFIMKDEVAIKVKLNELGIQFDKLIDY